MFVQLKCQFFKITELTQRVSFFKSQSFSICLCTLGAGVCEIQHTHLHKSSLNINIQFIDFPGGPAAKTLSSQCRGPGFDP